jgi:hypothetical protein
MGVLTTLMGDMVPFCWEFTQHQRAFEEVKQIVAESHDCYRRILLKYSLDTDPIFMVTDGS